MIQLIILLVLFILDIYILIISPYLDERYKKKYKEKVEKSKKYEVINNITILVANYPTKTLLEVNGEGDLDLSDIDIINISKKTILNNVVFRNVKKIKNLNISCKNIEFVDSNYMVKDDAIFDKNDELVFFYNDKTKKELIHYAENYSVSKKALKYFTNASYVQFNKRNFSLRISKPYNEDKSSAWLVVPQMVDKYRVFIIDINFKCLDYLYISKYISTLNLEVESRFKKIRISKDNHIFKIREKSLLDFKKKVFVNYNKKIFCAFSSHNSTKIDYKCKYCMKRYVGMCRILPKK